jgi:hypothetical protein
LCDRILPVVEQSNRGPKSLKTIDASEKLSNKGARNKTKILQIKAQKENRKDREVPEKRIVS